MSSALLDSFSEPKIYISALNLKYEHENQYEPISILSDKGKNSEFFEFFLKNFQYPKDLGLVHSACAAIHYISLTELNYGQKLAETEFPKWQKVVMPFVDSSTNVIIAFMNHKWMIETIYKSCLLTCINLLKLAVKSSSKNTIVKILKFLTERKSFNDFHVELSRELLIWATSSKTNLNPDNEKLVLKCVNRLFSYNSDYSKRIASIFTVIWANSLSCKDNTFYNLLFSENVPKNISEDSYHSRELINKIINVLDTFKLFVVHGPKMYFSSSKSPQPTLYHDISIDNILRLGICALKIANSSAKNQFKEVKTTEEQITDDSVFVLKAKMNFVPLQQIDIDLFVNLYRSALDMMITLVKRQDDHFIFTAGTLYKDFVKEVFYCNNNLESQKILYFFGEYLAEFLDVLLNGSFIGLPIHDLNTPFDLLVLNQLELLCKTKIKDKKLIFRIGRCSLEVLTVFAKFVSKNLLPNIITNLPIKIIYSLEHIVRIYIAAIRGDGNGWESEFIDKNMEIILKFLSFAFSGYLQVPINISNNVQGLIKLYDKPLNTSVFNKRGISQSCLRVESMEILRRYQQVWEKILKNPVVIYTAHKEDKSESEATMKSNEGLPRGDKVHHEELDKPRLDSGLPDHYQGQSRREVGAPPTGDHEERSIPGKEGDSVDVICTEGEVSAASISPATERAILLERMKKRSEVIKKLRLQ